MNGNLSGVNTLTGNLGFKGERGYSAYEVAVQNGYNGTVENWLATLGESSHFARTETIYTTTVANQTEFDIPSDYSSNSYIDIFVEGERINTNSYTINSETGKIVLSTGLDVVGTKVEVVVMTMSTNNLPIVTVSGTSELTSGLQTIEVDYPSNVDSSDCLVSVMSSLDNTNWIFNANSTDEVIYITKVKLGEKINITFNNTGSTTESCYYKLIFIKN